MAIEIERKFLVVENRWDASVHTGRRLTQGYLSSNPTVRVRASDTNAWITIKAHRTENTRQEFEYEIPLDDARELLVLCGSDMLDKTRYDIAFGNHVWEVDVFHGDNDGLIIAEIELSSSDEQFEKPDFVGEEVSADRRYANSQLASHPFRSWSR